MSDKPENSDAFRARSLDVSLTVKELQQSVDWYRDVVGFTVNQRYERESKLFAVSLGAGDVRILLTQDDGAKGLDRAKGDGFSMQFTTEQSIDGVAARVTGRGWPIDAPPADMPWGVRMFRMKDPDGFRITMSSVRNG